MLIIEGADLVGKTTFARQLMKRALVTGFPHALRYDHFGLLPPNWDYYRSYLPYIAPYTVMDRFIASEAAYGTICRGRSKIDGETYKLLNAHLLLCGSLTVLITADENFLDQQWKKKDRSEDFNLKQIIAVNSWYCQMFKEEYYDLRYEINRFKMFPGDDVAFIDDVLKCWGRRLERIYGVPTVAKVS